MNEIKIWVQWFVDNQGLWLSAIGTITVLAYAVLTLWQKLHFTTRALDVTTSSIRRFGRTTPGTPGSADDVWERIKKVVEIYPAETTTAIDNSIARIPETEAKIASENIQIPARLK